jgi:sterol desaturase/sphingolipid hydroxylase (fatty acid hydroxylase superfamily)
MIGQGFLQDAIWFIASAPTEVLLGGLVIQFLHDLYDRYLGFLTVGVATTWPHYLQLIVALLVIEFCFWLTHFAKHKIPLLWLFHAVHHSQKDMNPFTEDRNHIIDKLVRTLLIFIPCFIFQVPNLYAVSIIGFYTTLHSYFVHANIKLNLGWLGWFLVSPQFHRVHHARDVAYQDCNFGGLLSIFDHLFGTAYPVRDIYPETGIADAQFPTEDNLPPWKLPGNWLAQTVYPFGQLFKQGLVALRLRFFHP